MKYLYGTPEHSKKVADNVKHLEYINKKFIDMIERVMPPDEEFCQEFITIYETLDYFNVARKIVETLQGELHEMLCETLHDECNDLRERTRREFLISALDNVRKSFQSSIANYHSLCNEQASKEIAEDYKDI